MVDQNDPHNDTRRFTEALLGYVPDDKHSLLWTLQDKRSTWVDLADNGPAKVADRAVQLADDGKDVYIAVSVANQQGMYDTRIKSDNSAGIMGLWADIDIAAPDVHKKWNLPPDEKSAFELLDRAGVEPSLVIHSGHGLQAWWLFAEFWEFDSDEARQQAAGLAQRWNTTLRVRAAEKEWVVDSTFDLARVMRIPGTLNRKGTPVMPVRLLHYDETRRFGAEDFDQYLVDDKFLAAKGLSPTRQYQPDALELTESAMPNFEKFEALRENDELFARTWEMKRKDLLDQSPSSYDMSLVSQAVRAGWTDQEIAPLLLHFRRKHKLDVSKALRQDYVRRTISRARDSAMRDDGSEALEDVGEALDEARRTGDDEDIKTARRAALDVIGQQLGLEIIHFIKYTSEPPAFALVTPTHQIDLGGADGILVWSKFRQSVWEATGHQIDRFRTAAWDQITSLIPRSWEEQDVGMESTEHGEMYVWLSQYLGARPPVATLQEAIDTEYPYVDDHSGRVVIFGPAFKRWLFLTFQERVTSKELGRRLRAFGADPDKVNVEDGDGKRTSRAVWRLPASGLT